MFNLLEYGNNDSETYYRARYRSLWQCYRAERNGTIVNSEWLKCEMRITKKLLLIQKILK